MKEFLSTAVRKARAVLRDDSGFGTVEYVILLAFAAGVAAVVYPNVKTTITTMYTEANAALAVVGK